jgi:hypothetical protein
VNHDAVSSVHPDFSAALDLFTRASQPLDRVLALFSESTADLVSAIPVPWPLAHWG